jgi:neutral ceramidase
MFSSEIEDEQVSMESKLRAGAAKVDITPTVGTELCGHFRPDLRSTGIHSGLFSKALVIDDGVSTAAIVSCDLIGVTSTLVASTRQRISNLTGIDSRNIMVSCTHTHSGPGSMPLRVIGRDDETYQKHLMERLPESVRLASRKMEEASIGIGSGIAELAASRRVRWPDGTVRFDWMDPNARPENPIDQELNVLTVRGADGKTTCVVINFACHPTTIYGQAWNLISSDFPGVATAFVEKEVMDDRGVCLFLNGAYGDTHPRKDLVSGYNDGSEIRGDELTAKFGTVLGSAAVRISETTQCDSKATVQVSSKSIRVPLERAPSEDELKSTIPKDRAKLQELARGLSPKQEWWSSHAHLDWLWLKTRIDWHEHVLELYRKGQKFGANEDLEIQVMKLGKTHLVGIPGEVFSGIGISIKNGARALGVNRVLVVALANGNVGYIPTEEDYDIAPIGKRGYELEGSYMLYGHPLVGSKTGNMVVESTLETIRSMSSSP